MSIRRKIAVIISKKLVPEVFSIISDDCWGGQFYRQLGIPYRTPTVGLWIDPKDYLDYIENLKSIHNQALMFMKSEQDYPVATLNGITLHFMHYMNQLEAETKYTERYGRINWNNLLIKIDFGKPGYTMLDIERWNQLHIPNSIAFYPSSVEIPKEGIFNGVEVPDWQLDGAKMFDITRKHFDVFKWIRTGKIANDNNYQLLNTILFDPTSSRRIKSKLFKRRTIV